MVILTDTGNTGYGTDTRTGTWHSTWHITARDSCPGDTWTCATLQDYSYCFLLFQSLDLTLSDLPIGNPEYVQSCPLWAASSSVFNCAYYHKSELYHKQAFTSKRYLPPNYGKPKPVRQLGLLWLPSLEFRVKQSFTLLVSWSGDSQKSSSQYLACS